MSDFQIKYEIKASDYAEANSLITGRRFSWEMLSFLGAALLLVFLPLAYRQADDSWSYPFLVVPFAAFLAYWAVLYVFPGLNARRYYPHTNLSSNSFTVHFSADQIKVRGEHVAWVTEWAGFRQISESQRLFVFCDGFMIYIFAKRYFTPEQISQLQQLIRECWNSRSKASS
jgi:hypothetical protein